MKFIVILFLLIFCFNSVSATIEPVILKTEYLINPLAINTTRPRLSWQLKSQQRNQFQFAFELIVSDNLPDIMAGKGNIWTSGKQISEQNLNVELSMHKLKAIFISHEHSDHINGIRVLASKYRLPVYSTPTIMRNAGISIDQQLVYSYQSYQPVSIGNLKIIPFPKLHDASDPYSFIIGCNGVQVGVFTDIGKPCEHVIKHFKLCHAAFLECNYDEQMLETGRYPYHLKKRIQSEKGHLSNVQALELFKAHRPKYMSHLFLSHLSKENNCPKLAQQLFNEHASGTQIVLASRFKETPVYLIRNNDPRAASLERQAIRSRQLQFSFS